MGCDERQSCKVSRVSQRLFLAGVAAIFVSYAGIYPNYGHAARMVTPWLMFLGIVMLAFAARIELRNHHWRKRAYNAAFWLILASGLSFSSFLAWTESHEKPSAAKLIFAVRNAGTPYTDRLELTNDCLKRSTRWEPASRCCLVVPLKPREPNVSLIFSVRNDSPTSIAELVQVDFQAFANVKLLPSQPWEPAESSSLIVLKKITNSPLEWLYHIPYALLPQKGHDTPEITATLPDITSRNADWPIVTLYVEAKDAPPRCIGFNLLGSSLIKKPIVVTKHLEKNEVEWIAVKDLGLSK